MNIIEIITAPIRFIIEYVTNRIAVWRERRRYHEQISEYLEQIQELDNKYRPEKPDVIVAQQCRDYLSETFPNGIKEKVGQMSQEELMELFKDIESNAESLLGVHVDVVDFYTSEEQPICGYCGYYSQSDNSLHVNAALLLSGNVDLIEEQVYTIFHELKHARQWAAVMGTADYGYSDELLRSWAENMQSYIPPYEGDEVYRKQPLELDTFGFESILKGEKQFETT